MVRHLLLSLSLAAAACCASSPPPASPEGGAQGSGGASGAGPASEAPMAPVTAAIDVAFGEPVPGGKMGFRARLERHGVWTAPISVEFVVPRGAVVVGGQRASVVTEADDPPALELQLAEVPSEDLLLVARSTTEGAGFTAKARYRFGRPAPVKAGPDKTGPRLTTPTGVDLGPSVPVSK